MLEKLLSLLDSAMPEALGGIIAAAILAVIGGAWAYLRRRSRKQQSEEPQTHPQKRKYSVQEHKSEAHASGGFGGSLLSRDSFKVGHASGGAKLTFDTHAEKAEVDDDIEDIYITLPTGGKIIARTRRPIDQSGLNQETGSDADTTS